jgi:hypothetical protein
MFYIDKTLPILYNKMSKKSTEETCNRRIPIKKPPLVCGGLLVSI